MSVEFTMLGPVEVRRENQRLVLGGPQQRRLLAALLSQPGTTFTVDRLVELVWPDGEAPDRARKTLMTYVSRLRATLGDGHIETAGSGYRLRVQPETRVDAAQFAQLLEDASQAPPSVRITLIDAALALWYGPAFGDLGGEWWLRPLAERLEEQRVVANEDRAAALVETGQLDQALAALTELVAANPLRERPAMLLMRALAESGRKAEALRTFQQHRRLLAEETGLEPSPTMVSLDRSIATGEAQPEGHRTRRRGYHLREMVGQDGMCSIYVARQPGIGRDVAVTVIPAGVADDPTFVRTFESSAQRVARVEHPHLVTLYDFWREPGAGFLVHRLVHSIDGSRSLAADGTWPLERVDRLVEQVGGALDAAHRMDVTHGDLRPSRVLLEGDHLYLQGLGALTSSHPSALTDADDRFAFACLVWTLLTGVEPFPGTDSVAMLRSGLHRPLPAASRWRRDIPDQVDVVLARATSAVVEDRYGSIAEMAEAWSPTNDRSWARSAATPVSANPYRGLRPFGEADSANFFGRAGLVDALFAHVAQHRLTVVVGGSGSGKSSLLLAGLVPRLRAAGDRVVVVVPGQDPVGSLHAALLAVAVQSPPEGSLLERVRAVAAEFRSELIMVIDQWEEAWHATDDALDEFLDCLAGIDEEDNVRVIAAIRADFYDRPLSNARVGARVGQGTFPVVPMSVAELADAVAGPAARAGVTFEAGLDLDVVADVAGHASALPLMQYALAELYDRREGRVMTRNSYRQRGGVAGALAHRAEDLYDSLDDDIQPEVRSLFARLVTPGDGVATRRRARLAELSGGERDVVDLLVARRLLTTDRDLATREPVVEIAHESLLQLWPRLGEWLQQDEDVVRRLHQLTTMAAAWDDGGRRDDDLARGGRLVFLRELRDGNRRLHLNIVEQQFLDASTAAATAHTRLEDRRRRRLQRLLVATTTALAVAIVGVVVAVRQSDRATEQRRAAELTGLTATAIGLRGTQRDLAALLSVEAYRLSPNVDARSALFATLTHSPGFMGYTRFDGAPAGTGVVLDNGQTVLVGRTDGSILELDVDSSEVRSIWPPLTNNSEGPLIIEALSDGSQIAELHTVSMAGVLTSVFGVRDRASGDIIVGPIAVPFLAGAMAVSPDGTQIAIGGGTQAEVVVHRADDGVVVQRIAGLSRPADATFIRDTAPVAYLPDGSLLIGSESGSIRLVDPATAAEVKTFELPPMSAVYPWGVSPSGEVALAIGDRSVTLVDLTDGSILWRIEGGQADACTSAVAAWTSDRLYCGDSFGRLEARVLSTSAATEIRLDSQLGGVGRLLMTLDERELYSFSAGAPVVSRWRTDGSGLVTRMLAPGYQPREYVAADGRLLVEQQPDTPGAMLDPASGTIADLEGLINPQTATTKPSLYGLVVDSGGELRGAEYDLDARALVRTIPFPGSTPPVDGRPDATDRWFDAIFPEGDLTRVVRFDLVTGESRNVATVDFPASSVWPTATGRRIVVTGAPATVLLDADSGSVVLRIDGLYNGAVAGDTLIGSAFDGPLGVYDITTGELEGTLPGSRGYTQELFVSADGSMLLARGGDQTVSLYDLDSLTRIGEPVPIDDRDADQAALRLDGSEMALGGGPRGIAIWELHPDRWVDAACRLAGRNLTAAEWSTYLAWSGPYRETCAPSAS